MPTYDYRCVKCENEFESFLTISRREEPTKEACSECGGEVRIKPATPLFAYDNVGGNKKVDRAFKDRLKEIKRSHPGGNMSIPP